MTQQEFLADLAKQWRAEIERKRESIGFLERGELKLHLNDKDVTADHITDLHRQIRELEEAIPILEGKQT